MSTATVFCRISPRLLPTSFVACLCLVAVGCGKTQDPNRLPVFPVTGKITLKGEAPKGAFVVLHPKAGAATAPNGDVVRPRATVRDDGTFVLSSYESDDGAPEGEYSVTVEWQKIVKSPSGDPTKGPNLVPPQYRKPHSSPLTVRIAAGPNQLPPIVVK